ncbi:peptidoglycan DD-metalloendopeptidase family protein [Paenibacillus sp. GP183]|uniref:peptidoglycan DD-metalloendopeptidase family protein n=1 Tax=Paenibacillus sp. GP183 TaxID=1882751 RepID=UPI000899A249|nr:peptidoglycan DD-metalloendopeptidase family protein [Paenibacillus sp. GP183]SEC29887.1 Murein DD-endopeptidase MepM and murein hydrolase activator NlpD, contain LysM domain [Paenibacillus sp. GP183]
MTAFRIKRWVQNLLKSFQAKREVHETQGWKKHRWTLLIGASALTLAGSIVIAGNQYVAANMVEVYHVKVDQKEIGIVSNKRIIDDYKAARPIEVQQQNPKVQMVIHSESITTEAETAFHTPTNDQEVIAALNKLLVPQAVGVQLKVDGKVVAVLRDKTTANEVLDKLKAPFRGVAKESGQVTALTADPIAMDISTAPSELDQIDFVQDVQTAEIPLQTQMPDNPDDVVKLLQTGNVQPTKYTVVEGDCVSCIAKKLNITKQLIYDKNPSTLGDHLKIGQVLDLTVLQPAVSVKTVERVTQNQEIQYDTEYVMDESMRAGENQPISPGKNGLKKVTIQLTKVNGVLVSEQLLNEEVIDKAVAAKVKKGTKVVLGEGSGKFAWPVVSPSITSTFGYRWGKLHKGVDITGNKSILSADNGKVVETGYKDDYGNYIIINHMNGYRTLYGHLSKITIQNGAIVEKGEKIGIMGSTGDSTGVHLHFEIQKNGTVDNPLKYLNR